jgi:pterin-4a-carbinolamine dehydratase
MRSNNNNNSGCKICNITYDKYQINKIGEFKRILESFSKNKSISDMADEALNHYKKYCLPYNRINVTHNRPELPTLTFEEVKNHLNTCNKSIRQIMFSMIFTMGSKVQYYSNRLDHIETQIEELESNVTDPMDIDEEANEDGSSNSSSRQRMQSNLDSLKDEYDRTFNFYERNSNLFLKLNRDLK